MSQIWITSDWHFSHQQNFIYEPRGFDNVYDMNKEIIKKYNEVVQPDDDVYMLGDAMLNDNAEGIKCIKSLKGKIHIIRGNHDTETRLEEYKNCYNVIEISEGKFLRYKKYHFYLSHYPALTSNLDLDKPLHARIISLCGHSHVKDPFTDFDKGLIFHCEVDSNNCYPWNIEDIIKKIKERLSI